MTSSSLKLPGIPQEWNDWFCIKPNALTCVQDTVHIAVKLKARLLKPSGLIPMGGYVAGIQHLRMLQVSFGKDEHGLRERDIDHKDRQNFNAVMRASPLLQNIPDAQATKQFIYIVQCVVDAYLDKKLDPLVRIEKIWYAVFFLRYWRHWIILHPQYSLQNNFITQNAYMCIELNAHAIVMFLLTIREHFKGSSFFLPWLLGSQSCEKIFRSARSMTSTFSTIINFGMLGLLRRLHRLQIQSRLQSQSEETGIVYPQVCKHKSKDGGENVCANFALDAISDSKICEAVSRANIAAKASVESLGMADLLKKNKIWNSIPMHSTDQSDSDNDSDLDCDEEIEGPTQTMVESMVQETSMECASDIKTDIKILSTDSLIDAEVKQKLTNLQRSLSKFKKISGTSIPMYAQVNSGEAGIKPKFSPFVEVKIGTGKTIFIRKTTVSYMTFPGRGSSEFLLIDCFMCGLNSHILPRLLHDLNNRVLFMKPPYL